MKLIKEIIDLNKAINKETRLGFVPTMGSLHKGHEALIKISKKKCKKTLVSIFVNPKQFNNKEDYKNYPRNLNNDLKILKRLKVDYVFIPTIDQIYKNKKLTKISIKKSDKVLCANFRKGHFEGVLNVLNRFVILIAPKIIFLGEKDYQQFFLVKKFIEKRHKTKVYLCKTIRSSNRIALSSRNRLLNKTNIQALSLITNKLLDLKKKIYKNRRESKALTNSAKIELTKLFNIKIEYLENRNTIDLGSNISNGPFKLFVAFYLGKVRLIDNF